MTTGAGGVFTNNGTVDATLAGTGAPVTVSADDMAITGSLNAGTGIVTLQQATTTTRNIDLGGGTTAGDLGLSDAELGLVTAGVLRIGRTDNAGNISVTAPVTTSKMMTIVPSPVIDKTAALFIGTGDGSGGAWVKP